MIKSDPDMNGRKRHFQDTDGNSRSGEVPDATRIQQQSKILRTVAPFTAVFVIFDTHTFTPVTLYRIFPRRFN